VKHCLPDSIAAPLVLGGSGRGWPGAVNASGVFSRDGQEVAVVYYREGYVPKNYDQQVSAECFASGSHPPCGLAQRV